MQTISMELRRTFVFIVLCLYLTQSLAERQTFKHPHERNPSPHSEDIVKYSSNSKDEHNKALVYYLRLVKQMFKRERFKHDSRSSDDHYLGMISLRLTETQYELLVNTDIDSALNLNEIDDLIEEVFLQSNDENYAHSVAEILFQYYRQELIDSITSYSSPLLWIMSSVFAIYIATKFFHLSRMTFSAMIIFTMFVICGVSYAMMYHDCLNDLEVDQMMALSKENTQNNPCKDYHKEKETSWASFKAWMWQQSAESDCLKHMRKTLKPSKKYCDPLDVFAKWSAKIHMSYFGSILGELIELLSSATSSSGVITKIIYWTFSLAFFAFLLVAVIRAIIKHSFQGIFGLLSATPTTNSGEQRRSSFELLNSKMDVLLLENEHMKRELSTIRECSVERSIRETSPPRSKRIKLDRIEEKSINESM